MKTKILAIFTMLLLSAGIYAQDQPRPDGMKDYTTWEQQMDATVDEARHFYTFRIGIVTQRFDAGRAKLIVGIIGRTPNYDITVQPVNASTVSDSADLRVSGDPRQMMLEGDDTARRVSNYLTTKFTLDNLDPSTNALLVTLKPIAGKGAGRETAVLKAVFHLDKNEWFFEERAFEVPVSPIW